MRVVFLDRDGVINEQPPVGDWIKSPEEFKLLPGVATAIKRLNDAGFLVIVVTNQSCVGRKIITGEELRRVHDKMKAELAKAGAKTDDIYVCPHTPENNCNCRKPKAGLLLFAGMARNIVYNESWMVGDTEADVVAGRTVGCKTILVGDEQIEDPIKRADFAAKDLLHAVEDIVLRTDGY